MPIKMLADAVEEYCRLVCGLSEADLNRPWAWDAYDSEGVRFSAFVLYGQLRTLAARASGLLPPRRPAQTLLQQYLLAYRDLLALLLEQPADLMERQPSEADWSVQQTMAHITAGQVTFTVVCSYGLERFRQGLPPEKLRDEYWEARLGPNADEDEAQIKGPVAGQLALLAVWHKRLLDEFSQLTEAELDAPAYFWEPQTYPLRYRLGRFDAHLRQHTIQIEKTLAALGSPAGEARQLVRLLFNALAEVEGAWLCAPEGSADLLLAQAEATRRLTAEIRQALGM